MVRKNKTSKFADKDKFFFQKSEWTYFSNSKNHYKSDWIVLKDFQLEFIGNLPRYYDGQDSHVRFYYEVTVPKIIDWRTILEKTVNFISLTYLLKKHNNI